MASFADPERFRSFVEENFEGVASFAWSVLGSGLEAEDVAQEAFVLIYRARRRLIHARRKIYLTITVSFRLE